MKSEDAAPHVRTAPDRCMLTRRRWLEGTAFTAGLSALIFSPHLKLIAQEPRLLETMRAMSAMTGVELAEKWVGPTTSLVGVILDYSKVLRALDLGEIEPATFFVAG